MVQGTRSIPLSGSHNTHSVVSPSGVWLIKKCLGSARLKEAINISRESEASERGTKIHDYAGARLQNELLYESYGRLVSIPRLDTPDDIRIGEGYVKHCVNAAQSLNATTVGVEEKFMINADLNISGTADFYVIAGTHLLLIDLKTGEHEVPVEHNPQLILYAYGILLENKGIRTIETQVYQPSCGEPRGYAYSTEEIFAAANILFSVAERALEVNLADPQPEDFSPGEHCSLCDARGACGAYKDSLLPAIETFDANKLPSVVSDEQIALLVQHGSKLTKFIEEAKAYALHRAKEGNPIPGTKLVEASGRRFVKKDKADYIKSLGVNPYKSAPLKSISALEKELGPRKKELEPALGRTRAKLQVVAESDKRPALNSVSGFTVIGETKNENMEETK